MKNKPVLKVYPITINTLEEIQKELHMNNINSIRSSRYNDTNIHLYLEVIINNKPAKHLVLGIQDVLIVYEDKTFTKMKKQDAVKIYDF